MMLRAVSMLAADCWWLEPEKLAPRKTTYCTTTEDGGVRSLKGNHHPSMRLMHHHHNRKKKRGLQMIRHLRGWVGAAGCIERRAYVLFSSLDHCKSNLPRSRQAAPSKSTHRPTQKVLRAMRFHSAVTIRSLNDGDSRTCMHAGTRCDRRYSSLAAQRSAQAFIRTAGSERVPCVR